MSRSRDIAAYYAEADAQYLQKNSYCEPCWAANKINQATQVNTRVGPAGIEVRTALCGQCATTLSQADGAFDDAILNVSGRETMK